MSVKPSIKPLAYPVEPLIEALAVFDQTAAQRAHQFDSVESDADVEAAQKADKDALSLVQDAFYLVTKDRNSRQSCNEASIEFIRRIASSC
jgi:hypothetical protein